VNSTLLAVAERDDWVCWLCDRRVDPQAPAGSPAAPSVDHVMPRAHGGGSAPDNLRLAHRRCNTRRGSRVPELDWPDDLAVQHPARLLPALKRGQRRRGQWETVGVLLDCERAERAGRWLLDRAALVLGGRWEHRIVPIGRRGLVALAVRALA
jgi:hypothetical protein